MSKVLWRPDEGRIAGAAITAFREAVETRWQVALPDYAALHRWSVTHRARFWQTLWDVCGVVAECRGEAVLVHGDAMPGARWFPDARLNYAENLLRRRDDAAALVFRGEDAVRRRVSWRALRETVSRIAQALRACGVGPGDRVAGYLPNMPETAAAMLAASSMGAVWSSCSPDFGVRGVLDRFGQIAPKVLIGCDGYRYNGKHHDTRGKLAQIAAALPSAETVVMAAFDECREPPDAAVAWDEWLAPFAPGDIEFARLPFDHPLMILFSSGTTGPPKCIVHGAGGTLLKHLCEHRLHGDVRSGDRLFYFTTCGWMMWNWLVSGLASEATLLLYDGSPFHPSGEALFGFADAEGMTHFGTSARYLEALSKTGLRPAESHRLADLRMMFSTGSPLAPESFDYVYRCIKRDLCLSSISGGTDIVGCFALGNPALPVRRGELQCAALGMATEVWNDSGEAVAGEKGELVCTRPFPSMPVGFWNDADGARYRATYFRRFPGIWHHGDFAETTPSGGMIIHGRSDSTLNPGGVRIGTAEIYRQLEALPEVLESLVIGQAWGRDVRLVLFVVLCEGVSLDEALASRIKGHLRANASPRHVPAKIVQVAAVPRTRSGKLVELAVRDVVHGRPVANREVLDDPSVLDLYRDIPALAEP